MQEGRGKLFRLDALLGESCRQKKYSKFCPRSVIVDSIVGRTLRLGGFVDLQICESMKLDLNNMCDWRIKFGFTRGHIRSQPYVERSHIARIVSDWDKGTF